MTRQNAEHAQQADSLMKEANEIVKKANQAMSDLTNSMETISQSSQETSKIVKTIDEIAFQTNLLALNAARPGPVLRWWPTRSGTWPCGPLRPPKIHRS